MPPERWYFELEQFGQIVAEGDAATLETAERELRHYILMYGQDGSCVGKLWREDGPEGQR